MPDLRLAVHDREGLVAGSMKRAANLLRSGAKRVAQSYRLRKLSDRLLHPNWRYRVYPRPVIVVGNFKSGTTAITALLASCTNTRFVYDVFYFVPRHPGISLREYVQRNRRWFSAPINKAPEFTFMLPEMLDVFPEGRFVCIVRDPRDNVRSILNRLGIPGNLADLTPENIATMQRAGWGWIISNGRGGDQEHYVDAIADWWVRAAEAYLTNQRRIRLIRYEDFRGDKVGTIERLAADLGLTRVREIGHEVDRQFQTRGVQNVSWEAFFGPENLARLERKCGALMPYFGYVSTTEPREA